MINIISIKEAERQIRLDVDNTTVIHIPDLEEKLQQASQITMEYYKVIIPEQTSPLQESPTYELWANNPNMIPYDVKAFCALVLGALWKDREADTADIISEAIQRLGRMRRKPSMA